ncbi:unnamed protein product [Clonostachys rhizophaga]|uniref:Aminotransferase class I/classII large domain-containing protein n=1 Tax=Clonostachys rhizophaga TaxID=160324 RepID=A0A9N9VLG9_9HYPO|nr:unnamed protein product [Clonostachys rhizophaga]
MTSLLPTGKQINLQLGWPSPSLFPSEALNAAVTSVLSSFDAASSALVYGPSRGHVPLRSQMAKFLGSMYHNDPEAIEESRVCIAGGASQNLSNALLRFADPSYTRRVWMVEPTYFLACPVFEDCGFIGKLRGVPEDDEGIDLGFLAKALAETEAEYAGQGEQGRLKTTANGYEKIYKHIIYVVPTFSNPSGKTMSLKHRYELVRLAIEYHALVISDDVYDFLSWPHEQKNYVEGGKLETPPTLVDINRELDPESKWGNTMSNGSFSKIIAPGARVSWAMGTPAFVNFLATTGASISGGNPGHLSSTFIENMLSSRALQTHIEKTLIPAYSSRYYSMVQAIEEYLEPLGVKIITGQPYYSHFKTSDGGCSKAKVQVAGGFFLSIALPSVYQDVPGLAKVALENDELKIAYGKMFEVKGDGGSKERSKASFGNSIRLCWSFHEEEAIKEGIMRLRGVLLSYEKNTA